MRQAADTASSPSLVLCRCEDHLPAPQTSTDSQVGWGREAGGDVVAAPLVLDLQRQPQKEAGLHFIRRKLNTEAVASLRPHRRGSGQAGSVPRL